MTLSWSYSLYFVNLKVMLICYSASSFFGLVQSYEEIIHIYLFHPLAFWRLSPVREKLTVAVCHQTTTLMMGLAAWPI
jgi:hypothetical protein